jgi:hypothetical protein
MGKTKMATVCGHTDRSHYSSGMCQNCYLAKYYLKRKQKALTKEADAKSADSCVTVAESDETARSMRCTS